jgi:hypothetical protein
MRFSMHVLKIVFWKIMEIPRKQGFNWFSWNYKGKEKFSRKNNFVLFHFWARIQM